MGPNGPAAAEPVLAAAEPVLAALRRWRPVYARWAYHPCATAGCPPPPWSPGDEERLAALRALAPDAVARAAAGWRELATMFGRCGDGLVSQAQAQADPNRLPDPDADADPDARRSRAEPEARRYIELAGRLTARARRAEARADALDLLAERLDAALAEFTARLARLAAPLATGGYATPRAALDDIDAADLTTRAARHEARWPDLDELVDRHGAVLTTLRAGIDELLELTRAPNPDPWTGPPPGWCTANSGCAPATPTTPPAAAFAGADDPLREWQPLPPRTTIDSGPALPSTEARRVAPDVGVYLPLLPVRPPGQPE